MSGEHPCLVGHLAFTHRQALCRIVAEYLGRGKQGAVHLLLAGHIGAHAADVGARLHPFRLDKRLAGRGGGEDHVAVPDGLLQIGRGGDSGVAAAAAGQQLLHLRCDGFAGGRRALRMVGVGHIDRLDLRQQIQRGGNEIGCQRAGTGHQQRLGVRPRQILCADRPRRAGAEVGDGAGVQQRPGRAGGQIEQQGRAVQGGQLVQRYGVHAGLRNIEACAHFIFIHPFFHSKGLDVHSVFSFSCKKVKASTTKSYPTNAGIPTIRSWMPSTPQPVPREALPYSACFAL